MRGDGKKMDCCDMKKNIEKPQLSVLMSVYNAEKTLEKAIESILCQTFADFEFIICDDASTDYSWEILKNYQRKDRRIQIIQNESNIGLGASLNRCIAVAQGTYIARQDADDVSMPNRLEKTLRYLQQSNAPYVGCGVFIFDETGIWSKRMYPEVITKHIIAQKNPFFHPTMIFQADVVRQVSGYRVSPETRRTEDYDLVMRLAASERIGKNLQEYLYFVYEPKEAYQGQTVKTRMYEIIVRWKGLRRMQAPWGDYIYLLKPVIMCFIPRKILKDIKKIQWSRQEDKKFSK